MPLKLPDRARYRKNLLPAILVTIIIWFLWTTVFLFVPPDSLVAIILFLLLSFIASLFTGALVLGRTRRGVLLGIGVLIYMGLSFYGVANYLNLILIAGVILTLEYYFSTR